MTYSQKYSLVHFVQPISAGTEFNMDEWPLHITVADVFAIDRITTKIDAKLEELLMGLPVITVSAAGEATLGTTLVVLIQKDNELLILHTDVVNLLEMNQAVFNNPEFTRNGFHLIPTETDSITTHTLQSLERIGFLFR